MSNKPNSRQRQSELMRQKIYESAAKLFTERDYSEVTVESIVKLAGVAKGSFYVHFESKDAVIAELITEYVKEVDNDYQTIVQSAPPSFSSFDIIKAVVARIVDVLSKKVGCDKMKALYRAQLSRGFSSSSVFGDDRKLYSLMQDIIEKGIEAGDFRNDIDAAVLSRHLLIVVRGLTFEWCLKDGKFDYAEQTSSFLDAFLDALRISK